MKCPADLGSPIAAYRTSPTPSTTATSSSQPAAASAFIARKSTSRPHSPGSGSASKRSMTGFGSLASCATISLISTWRPEPCNPSTTPSARSCHPCLRYVPLPTSPARTKRRVGGGSGIRIPPLLPGKLDASRTLPTFVPTSLETCRRQPAAPLHTDAQSKGGAWSPPVRRS